MARMRFTRDGNGWRRVRGASMWERLASPGEWAVLMRIDAHLRRRGGDLTIYDRPTDGPYVQIVFRFWLDQGQLRGQADATLRPARPEHVIKVTQIS